MHLRYLNGYWTLFSGTQAVLSFDTYADAHEALQPPAAKFEGYTDDGMAIYSNVVL